jgi:hypothetical protein
MNHYFLVLVGFLLVGFGFDFLFFKCLAVPNAAAVLTAAFEIRTPVQMGHGIYHYLRFLSAV